MYICPRCGKLTLSYGVIFPKSGGLDWFQECHCHSCGYTNMFDSIRTSTSSGAFNSSRFSNNTTMSTCAASNTTGGYNW